ncbi:MAG TPA: ABC transporter permease subunit [Gemmataceae bacterium]|nr:ABC transporter permease subunit [Gemmataceae bacterium]
MPDLSLQRIWGGATAALYRFRQARWIDLLILLALAGLFYGVLALGREWAAPGQQAVEINLSPWALPGYALFSLSRGLIAYLLSLAFTLAYGYWAAKDRVAERVLIPLLDILQSIPVLGFMPGVVMALIALFPGSNVGLELAAILMIFTGQVWNMTFSFYHSLRAVPADQQEAATVYRFSWWQRLRWVELPFATIGLVWNSMMSMAGGWFFLMIIESFTLKVNGQETAYQLPGIGSYMSEAFDRWDVPAMFWAILAMVLMIVLLDQLLWRPVVAWAQKFRVEEGGAQEATQSWFLDWLRASHLLEWVGNQLARLRPEEGKPSPAPPVAEPRTAPATASWVSLAFFVALLGVLLVGVVQLARMLWAVPLGQWEAMPLAMGLTLGRVLLAVALGTLWTLPAGLAIGRSPRLSQLLQPAVQVAASFPAPMLYPLAVLLFERVGLSLQWGSVFLMLLGTQWYVLFNVIAGATAIPADLKEAAVSYRVNGWQRFWVLYGPAVFPYLVTGWVTAAGGAWNASIVAEQLTFGTKVTGEVPPATGLGSMITTAFDRGDFNLLAASVIVMSLLVIVFNRLVWKRMYHLAETRFSLSK